jgi:hypothetical protein
MDDVSVDGAIAAATYFLSLYPYVYNTGDLTQWKAMSHPECIFCASVVTGVEEMHGLGQHQEGADFAVLSVEGSEIDPGVWFSVVGEATQGSWEVLDSLGLPVRSGDPEAFHFTMSVVRSAEGWQIRAVEVTPTDG